MHLALCSTNVYGKDAVLLFLGHVCRLHGMPKSIVMDRDPHFTSVFWRHDFELSGSKLNISTADHFQSRIERVNRIVVDVLRTIEKPGVLEQTLVVYCSRNYGYNAVYRKRTAPSLDASRVCAQP